MNTTSIKIDTQQITDWESFHDIFKAALGFPDFYGRNMNAWIDCMTSLDEPEDGLTSLHAPRDGILVLELKYVGDFAERCPEIYDAIVECSAFVNYRHIVAGKSPVLALSFWRNNPKERKVSDT